LRRAAFSAKCGGFNDSNGFPMAKRALGSSELSFEPIVFGGNVFGWTADEATSFSLIDRFIDRGFTMIDTADVYSIWVPGHQGGESETIIGKWLQRGGRRDKIQIATKVGMDMQAGGKGLSKSHILASIDASLKRLNTDYVDLYQAHADDASVPLDETLEAFASLIASGKVRVIGASNYEAPRLAEALNVSKAQGLPRYISLQPHYNLANRKLFEGASQDLCVAEGIGVIPYYALASGFLTGKYRSNEDLAGRARARGASPYLNERGLKLLAEIDVVAKDLAATPAQIALAWLLAQPGITAPIVSATSLTQLDEILDSTRITLDKAALDRLDKSSA
jgi:aryl-alcohol dehydrogenase-like predicted oxidoreductase